MELSGLIIDTAPNYNSVPGLWGWLDSRNRKSVAAGKVVDWSSKTIDSRIYSASIAAQRPDDTSNWIDFNDIAGTQIKSFRSPKDDSSAFLHNGSPFGLFGIMGYKYGAVPVTSDLFSTKTGSSSGMRVRCANSASRLTFQLYQGSTLVTSHQSPASSLPQEVVNSYDLSRNSLDEASNFKIYINNALVTTVSLTSSDVITGVASNLLCGSASSQRILQGMQVIYNWTGYTSTEVNAFAAQVRALIALDKASFTYPV